MAAGDQPLGDAGVDDGAGRFHPLRLRADEAHASRTGTAISSDRFCRPSVERWR
jgi:hypothetical protein